METSGFLCSVILCLVVYEFIGSSCRVTSSDAVITERVRQFNKYCPTVKTCSGNTSSHGTVASTRRRSDFEPCCKPCRCNDECDVLDCCPDGSERQPIQDVYRSQLIRCIDSQYRPYSLYKVNGHPYKMVTECLEDYSDITTASKCRQEYDEVSLEKPLRYIVPVYDSLTGILYKNIHCAMCHGVEPSNFNFTQLSYKCYNWTSITYIRDISASLQRNDECNVVFEPLSIVGFCDRDFIDRCNVTGNWTEYNPDLEESCLSYTSVYKYKYKNVHCYLCNGFNETTIEELCEVPDPGFIGIFFILVLDFYTSRLTLMHQMLSSGTSLPQHKDILYNSEKKVNWTLSCPSGMKIIKEDDDQQPMCIMPPGEYIKTQCYIVSLKLQPRVDTQNTSLSTVLLKVWREVDRKIKELMSGEIIQINGFIQLTRVHDILQTNKTHISFQTINYVAIQLKIKSNLRFATILDFANVFTTDLNFDELDASFYHFGAGLIEKQQLWTECFKLQSDISVIICTDNFKMVDQLSFVSSFTDTSSIGCSTTEMIQIEPEPFCPRIVLPKPGASIVINGSTEFEILTLILTEPFMSLLLAENDTHLFFCHEDYYQHLTELEAQTDFILTRMIDGSSKSIREYAIMYMTIGALVLSLVALTFTLLIYSMYSELRTLPGRNNMALVSSLFIFQVMSLINTGTYVHIEWLCSSIGIVTHFSLICSFAWMFVCTFHMMKVFIKVKSRPTFRSDSRTFLIYIIFTTAVAMSIVTFTMIAAEILSGGEDLGYGGVACYIKNPKLVLIFVAIPVAIVVILNFAMYCIVVVKISMYPNVASHRVSERTNITIFAKLSTITGLTWIFGLAFVFLRIDAFMYIYIILNAGQGVFIMISFIFNRRVFGFIRKTSTAESSMTTLRVRFKWQSETKSENEEAKVSRIAGIVK